MGMSSTGWPPPAPPWGSPWTTRRGPEGALVAIILAVVLGVILVPMFFVFAFGGSGFPAAIFAPFCGVFVIIVIVVIAVAASGYGRRTVPPPPPIQQPMVPAGAQGPIDLSCPNCGAPPSNVDRFGVATCPYCSTRFLVR